MVDFSRFLYDVIIWIIECIAQLLGVSENIYIFPGVSLLHFILVFGFIFMIFSLIGIYVWSTDE